MNFCTVADIELLLQVDISSDADLTASAERAIKGATAAIKNYCYQEIERVAGETITVDMAEGRSKLFLPELPVVSVASVVEDGEALVATDDYKLGERGVLHRVGQDWTSGIQVVAVTYTHGHDPIPDDVADVCTRAAARAYQAGRRAAASEAVPGVSSKALGDYQVSYGSEGGEGVMGASAAPLLLRSEKELLDKYRYKPQ